MAISGDRTSVTIPLPKTMLYLALAILWHHNLGVMGLQTPAVYNFSTYMGRHKYPRSQQFATLHNLVLATRPVGGQGAVLKQVLCNRRLQLHGSIGALCTRHSIYFISRFGMVGHNTKSQGTLNLVWEFAFLYATILCPYLWTWNTAANNDMYCFTMAQNCARNHPTCNKCKVFGPIN